MALLAACCLAIGLAPALAVPLLQRAAFSWAPEAAGSGVSLAMLVPFGWISGTGLMLALLLLEGGLLLWLYLRRHVAEPVGTWDCGYAAPSPRMQYTASSFAQMLVGWFAWALRPTKQEPHIEGLFPASARFESQVPDPALEQAVVPVCRWAVRLASGFRIFQQGSIQAYLLYIFGILIVLFLWR